MLDTRKEHLLSLIVRSYVATAEPVGSGWLVEKYRLPMSPATARNDLAALEEEGYITHPHTSAGRIPTEKGYRYFVDHLDGPKLQSRDAVTLKALFVRTNGSFEEGVKAIAKGLSQLSAETVMVGFTRGTIYYTGLRNLFSQPDFADQEIMTGVGEVLDRAEEAMDRLFEELTDEVEFFLGEENPFAPFCGMVACRYKFPRHEAGVLGIVGPMRMDYERAWGLVKGVRELAERVR